MSQLTAAQRRALPASAFAGPHRSYPIQDASHARNALARAAQFASSKERNTIERKVRKQFPGIGKPSKDRDAKVAMFAGRKPPGPGNRITEDSPHWNPRTMGNKRGNSPGYYRKGSGRPD